MQEFSLRRQQAGINDLAGRGGGNVVRNKLLQERHAVFAFDMNEATVGKFDVKGL